MLHLVSEPSADNADALNCIYLTLGENA